MAAGVALWGADALAQTAAYLDPLTPQLQTDPRNPPRFQRFERPALAQLGPPAAFTPPASGAGDTGFDSSNSRKKAKAKAKAKPPANAQTIAPGLPAPTPASLYQKSATGSADGAYAQAPGTPPVDLGPIRQAPKKRKAHTEPDDPYAPLGVRSGAFTWFPAIGLIGGYDTNPAGVPGAPGAKLYTVAPELQVQSNWSRHEFKADLRGSYTGFSPDETPTLSRPYFNANFVGRVDVTKDTRIDLGSLFLVSTDNPGSPNLQAGLAKLPIFVTGGGSIGLGQRLNRLDLSIEGDVARTVYQNSTLTDGSTSSNDDRNFDQYGTALRVGYELLPGMTPYVTFGANTRHHDLNADFYGYQRDSNGLAGIVGSTFRLTNLLTGDLGIGYGTRTYEDPRLAPLSGLIGNGSLVWTANALTAVKLTVQSTIAESTIPGVSGVLSRDVGLQVDHSLRRWLIATLRAGFGVDSYKGTTVDTSTAVLCDCVVSTPGGTAADRVDYRYSVGAGLTYKLNRSVQIKGEFQQQWLRSNVTGVDYAASIFLLGIRFQR
jgi:hypothetical protein